MKSRRIACVVMALLMTSCGGGGGSSSNNGGGGGGGGGSNSLRFTPSRTSISFEYVEGNAPAAQRVIVTATGEYSGTLYLGAVAGGSAIDPFIELTVLSDTQGEFAINAKPGLAVGDYSGTIQLLACSDEACNRQVGNSPVTLNYVVHVRPSLRLTPDAITLAAVSGNNASADINVTLPFNVTTFTATPSDPTWLTVTQPTPTTLRVVARSMPVGTRTGSVLVESGTYQRQLNITYNVSQPPGGEFDMRATPGSVTLNAIEGTTSNAVTLTVLGPTWDPATPTTYNVYPLDSNPATWLTVTPVANGYELRGDAIATSAGVYQAQLAIAGRPPAGVVNVPVTFTVGSGLIQPANINAVIDATTTASSPVLSGSVPINVATGGAINWSATEEAPWLTLTRASGSTGTSLQYSIDPFALDLTSPHGDYQATVTIHPAKPNMLPVTFRINALKRLPDVTQVSPTNQYLGRASRHIVRGRNFVAGRDWSQHLLIDGVAAGNQVTRVNDTELVLNLQPLTGTYHYIELTNALITLNNSDVGLVTNAPRVFPYAARPTGFEVKAVAYRHLRGHIHLVDEAGGRLVTEQWGGGWVETITPIPGIRDVTVSVDGDYLYAAGTNGVARIDGNFFNASPSGNYPDMAIADHVSAIVQTNDLRIWYATASAQGYGVSWFQPESGESGTISPNDLQASTIPWFARSRDGERVFISVSGNFANIRPRVFNAADYVVSSIPEYDTDNEDNLIDASISDDGSRMVSTSGRVRKSDYSPIGYLSAEPDDYVGVAYLVSPDSRRGYMLAYHADDVLTNPSPQHTPRIYVFDLTTPGTATQLMPRLGWFSIPHFPSCVSLLAVDCQHNVKAEIADDGSQLVFAGNWNFVWVPVPAEATLNAKATLPPVSKPASTKRWDVNTRAN